MASKDFLIRLSMVFKKFGLIANEFLSVICQFLNVAIINLSLEFYISHINGFPILANTLSASKAMFLSMTSRQFCGMSTVEKTHKLQSLFVYSATSR